MYGISVRISSKSIIMIKVSSIKFRSNPITPETPYLGMNLAIRLTFRCLIFLYAFCLLTVQTFGQDFQFSLEIANPNPVGSGARALGQGNTFIAVADDATAASWNPAGLLQLQHPEFSFAFEAISNSSQISSNLHPESESRDSFNVEDFNYASLVLLFYLWTNMVFSLNYLKLFRFDKEMEFPVSQLFDSSGLEVTRELFYNFDQEGSFSVLAPAFGFSLAKNLLLGVSLNIWNHNLTQSSRFKKKEVTTGESNLIGMEDGVEIDIREPVNIREINELKVDEGYSVVFGGLLRMRENWHIGVVVKPKYDLELDHEIRNKDLGDSGVLENDFEETRGAELDMPMIIGAGLSWRPYDALTISTDATWTQWSEYTFVDKKTKVVKNPLTGQSADEGELEDTFTVRAGCEYYLIRETYLIPFRFGLGYDPAPAVDRVDDYYTINCGTGIQIGSYNLDIGYEFRWGNNVNGSSLQPIDATQDVYRHRVLASLIYYF